MNIYENNTEPSMKNPPIESFKYLDVGNTFIFKGDYCTVKSLNKDKNGFSYTIQNSEVLGYMSFSFYLKTQSAKGRKIKN